MNPVFTPQQILSAFANRQSCRDYDPERTISQEDFEFILELGRRSPSSVGSEPWQFVIIQNPALRAKLKPVAWGMAATLDTASHVVVILAKRHARYDSEWIAQSMVRRGITEAEATAATIAKYEGFQRNDMPVLDDERTLFDWCAKQAYIALANMMTGAAMAGIDSCPVEGFNYAAVNRILAQEGIFDPAEWGVAVAATFGYRRQAITPKARRSMADVCTWVN